ncbi:PQQ-dependent sugar dehydrogenase [Arenibacter sp. F26102]|uniref:PQQ-dependent sugar dehydrogenase n=1 Tax=Arenibacter sp. F26102 TaxID=2926416 RepID=UPI001FF2C049|nr:PQQ-dependent sugar dehydrogenase [Arenibacter sp. F26102]MCK0147208.1 PQQ-dependent sugar dehydrogenase [Arenibacter sp. F26102]
MAVRLSPYVLLLILLNFSCGEGNKKTQEDSSYQKHLFKKTLETSQLAVSVVASNLDYPWDLCWGNNEGNILWFTEIKGTVNQLNTDTGEIKTLLSLEDVLVKKSYGLLGFAVHPDIESNPYVFLHYAYLRNDEIRTKLVRYRYSNGGLESPKILLEDIPGATYHNGSRIVISPNNKILISLGDAGRKSLAQSTSAITGKVLRLNLDGSIPDDNPIKDSPVWSWGHRNPQGLVMGNGKLYSSEHGEANDDELNIIEPGGNYGWPDVTGYCNEPYEIAYCKDSTIVEPIKQWTPTIAPSGIAYYGSNAIPEWTNSILVGSLKGASLRVLKLSLDGTTVEDEFVAFNRQFGRIRDVIAAPNGDIYLCTSNKDWHPKANPEFYSPDTLPFNNDDKIIRIHQASDDLRDLLVEMTEKQTPVDKVATSDMNGSLPGEGMAIYQKFCASCHKANGSGSEGFFPPISKTEGVANKDRLIKTVVSGLSGPLEVKGKIYNQEMPSFKFLTDKELADVLTYVRASFGNGHPSVIEKDISEYRASLQN